MYHVLCWFIILFHLLSIIHTYIQFYIILRWVWYQPCTSSSCANGLWYLHTNNAMQTYEQFCSLTYWDESLQYDTKHFSKTYYILEQPTASIFRACGFRWTCCHNFQSRRQKQQVPLKHSYLCTTLHGDETQTIRLLIFTAVRTSNVLCTLMWNSNRKSITE